MRPKRILCPIDFSQCSFRALDHATDLAKESGGKLYVVHVENDAHPILPGRTGYVEELDEHQRLLTEGKPNADVDFEQHCLRGNVTDELLRFAILRKIDTIVMGTHGRSGLAKALLGSVAESLSRDAPCEVVTVSPNQQATSQ